jgi:hypothetical protein
VVELQDLADDEVARAEVVLGVLHERRPLEEHAAEPPRVAHRHLREAREFVVSS